MLRRQPSLQLARRSTVTGSSSRPAAEADYYLPRESPTISWLRMLLELDGLSIVKPVRSAGVEMPVLFVTALLPGEDSWATTGREALRHPRA